MPYEDLNAFQIAYRVKMKGFRPDLPEAPATHEQLGQLIRACWHSDPAERPSFADTHRRLQTVKADGYWAANAGASTASSYNPQVRSGVRVRACVGVEGG